MSAKRTVLNPGRKVALEALLAVDKGMRPDDHLDGSSVEGRDRALAHFLVLGVLRRRGALDAAIADAAARPVASIDAVPLQALRLGAFEVLLGRALDHAAVSQAVEACRDAGAAHAAGFVNAVLRKLEGVVLSSDPRVDLPAWLAERWKDQLAWLERASLPARVAVAMREGEPQEGAVPASAGGEVIDGAWWLPERIGFVGEVPEIREGRAWVMDPAAAKVADIAWGAALRLTASGEVPRLLDACAAPGGKALRLAARGANVVAVDRRAARLRVLQENVDRVGLGSRISIARHDWEKGAMEGQERFPVVLVDAPCTALGTIRRHPEVRWTRQPADLLAMAILQQRILRAAALHVAPGGALVYAVCSPFSEEGQTVVASLQGWRVKESWSSVPPQGDEDAHQAFVLEIDAGG